MEKPNRISDHVQSKSKKAQAWFSHVRIPSFDHEKVWESISHKLDNLDKRVMSWFMAMATSFTLLVAAGLEYANYNYQLKENAIESVETASVQNESNVTQDEQEFLLPTTVYNVKTKQIRLARPEKLAIDRADLISKKETHGITPKSNLTTSFGKLGINGSLNVGKNQFLPGIGLDIRVIEWNNNYKNHSINVGWQGQFIFSDKPERSNENLIIGHFVTTNYEFVNSRNKGWTFGAGYLINPDGNLYKEGTVKLSALRKLNKHVKLGPEIILTEGYKKVIPTLTLAVNS